MKRQTLLKSTLCLLMALVCNVAWAQAPVQAQMKLTGILSTGNNATYHDGTTSGGWYGKLVKNSSPKVTFEVEAQDKSTIGWTTKESIQRPMLQAGENYIVSLPEGYLITGYTLVTQSTTVNNKDTFKYTTANGLEESVQQTTTNDTITVEGLSTNQIEIDLTEYNKSGTNGILIWDITLNYTVEGMPYISNAPSNGAWDANTVWYQIKNQKNKVIRADVLTNEGYLALTNGTVTQGDAGLWCIVGNVENGYKFYNRAKGTDVFLGMKGNEAQGLAVFVDANAEGYTTAFDIVASTDAGYCCMKDHGSVRKYWNQRDPRLAYWAHDNGQKGDDGSTFLFTQVDLSTITGLATEEDIEAAQAWIKVAPGYPKTTTNQYRVLDVIANSPTKGAIKTELDAAVTAYKACSDIILPEDGKAYTFTLVHTDKAEYKISVDANKHLQATTDGTAATFYCHAFMVGNEQRYVFISEEGKILAYQTVTDTYTIVGNLTNDFTAGGMYSRASNNNVTSTQDERFGLIYLTAKARTANNATAGNIIYKPTGATAFNNSSDPFHNATYTSAIKATEVPGYTINDVQAFALAKVKAKVQIAAMKLGSYFLTDKNGVTYNSLTTAATVVEAATTTEEIDAFIASRSLNLPTPGTAYYLKDNHGTYLDLHHLGADGNGYEHELATMSATKQLLYITGNEADGTWKIHTTVNGGNYLHQSSTYGWNSKVSSNGGDFKWEVEGVDVSGTPHYMLKNISGTQNGYLGADSHTAGNALYVNQSDNAKKLKLQLLPVKNLTTEFVPVAAEWLNEESVAVPSDEVPDAVDEKYKEKVVSSGEYFYISAGRLKGVFQHRSNSGNNRTDIVAVEVIDLEGNIVAADYHWGYTGNNSQDNIYTMDIPKDGLYYIRYYAEYLENGGAHNSDVDITYINGPAEGYYYMSNRDVARHEHLYNNALHSGNATKRLTLQSDTRVETNNGIWRITHNLDGTMSVKNGDGNAIVPGNSSAEPTATHNTLHIGKIAFDGTIPYYYFSEALNCSKSGYSLNGINILTTWAGYPEAADNQWRLDPVSVEGKTIYEVVVSGDANAYVAYNDGTTTQNAFNGGFFIADEPITEAQLKAGFVGNVVKSATITVEGNVITLADVVTFPTPVKQDLYNTSNGSLEIPPHRIPGITVDPETGRIITTAARLVCGTDPGYGQVDVVCRISDNHGVDWTDTVTVARGTGITSPTENYFDTAFGDPAVVADRTSNEVLIIVVAGCTKYQTATREIPNMIGTIHSLDNGNSWEEPVNVTEDIYSLFDSGNPMQSAFVGGGKIFQSRIVKVGQYYRLYAAMCARPNGNRVIYSDDFGRTWHALGGASALPAPGGDEPKCEEMPDGRVILSSRVGGGRIYNIYTYSNTTTAEGSWGTSVTSTFEGSGKTHNGQSTNGEILIVPVQRNSDQKEMYLALQSLPAGGGRSHVGIFYKELTDMTDINTVANFAIDWNGYFEVTDKSSAYSSMDLQNDDRIGFIYEENYTKHGVVSNPHSIPFPDADNLGTHNYDGYDNIYVAYPLEIITNNAYSIRRDVDRRAYLQTYFTDLTADVVDEVKNAVAADLEDLSTEPTIDEIDNIYFNIGKGSVITAANANAGKVGYYLDDAVATYKEEVMAAMTREQLVAAETKLIATNEWNMPVSGKAYTFKNVQKDGTTIHWYKYDAAGDNIVLTANEAEATPFVCRLLDNGKYVFVCNDGKYMTWRAAVSGCTTTGVNNAYHGEGLTDITIAKMTAGGQIATGIDLSNTRYISISAKRPDRDETGYVVVKKNNGNPTFDGAGAAFYNDSYSSAFIMDEATYANTPKLNGVNNSELMSEDLHGKYMGTFSAPFPTIIPEGVTAYYGAEGADGAIELVSITNAIPANQGVILVGEEDGNVVMKPAAAETQATIESNALAHSAGAAIVDLNGYVLAANNGVAGFYKAATGSSLAMNKAYIASPQQAGANAPAIRIRLAGAQGGTPTGIDNSEFRIQNSEMIYDLMGRRVLIPTKGMYIVNGKKIVIK